MTQTVEISASEALAVRPLMESGLKPVVRFDGAVPRGFAVEDVEAWQAPIVRAFVDDHTTHHSTVAAMSKAFWEAVELLSPGATDAYEKSKPKAAK